MADENNESEEFPGLYASEASYRSDSDYGDNSHDRGGKKDILKQKKKDKNKDKGYAALGSDSSTEEMDSADNKTPIKSKKPKSFKFLHKKDREEKDERKDDKKKKDDKEDKKKEKRREKEEKKKEKEEKKKIKKDRKKKTEDISVDHLPIFGIPLAIAVERHPCHDGIRLPLVVRECIDFIEEKGLLCEGIYRLGGMKNKIQSLRRAYNSSETVHLDDQNPHVVASLLKQYLRELPETVLTVDMMAHFEDVSLIPNPKERSEAMRQLIDRLPTPNRVLLQYVLKHMGNVVENENINKMSYQNVCIVLSPTMQISHRVLNVMFLSHNYLFGNVIIKRYFPPICSHSISSVIEELKSSSSIAEEINKQESLLATLHKAIASGVVSRKTEERLWEAQRIVTLLKRKLKLAKRKEENPALGSLQEKDLSSEESQREGSLSDAKMNSQESIADDPVKEYNKTNDNSSKNDSKDSIKTGNEIKYRAITVSPEDYDKIDAVGVRISNQKEQIIPILPKPVSSKMERNKISQSNKPSEVAKHHQKESTTNLTECSITASGSPFKSGHITVVKVGENTSTISYEKPQTEPPKVAPRKFDKKPVRRLHQQPDALKPGAVPIDLNAQDREYEAYLLEEKRLQLEHEELLNLNHHLTRKLQNEKSEISKLKDEIQEMQTLYGYRTYSYDSSESGGSESEGESETEEDILKQIIFVNKANSRLQSENTSLVDCIQKEREKVIELRISLRQMDAKPNIQSTQPLKVF